MCYAFRSATGHATEHAHATPQPLRLRRRTSAPVNAAEESARPHVQQSVVGMVAAGGSADGGTAM